MSSLLRSTKFVRYFTGAARTLILNTAKTAEANSLINPKAISAANNVLMRDYATSKKTESLEPLLLRLDSEVRRFGRISKRDIDEVFDEIRAKNDITSAQSLLVIRCCGELVPEELPEQRTLLVQKIWSVLTERGIPMDISHYNALLRVYIENEHPFSPAMFLEELEKKGLQPNRVTYQRLMWRYCQEGDVEGATKVLEKMRELSLPVSEPVLNALVMGHSFHGDTEGAKAVLETMAGAGLEPTNRTYTLLACGYAKKGDIKEVLNVIKTSTEKDIFMTDKDILDVIEHLAVGGHGDKVEQLLPHLQKGVGYKQDVCNLILRLINKGHIDTAKRVMKTMPKSANVENTMFKGAFFVKQLLRLNSPSEVLIKNCRDLQNEELVPSAIYIATETALQQGKTELAQLLFDELKKDGFEIRQHYYWPLLLQKGKEGDEEGLLQILRKMSNDGLQPSGETLRDYVIPFLINKDSPQNVITKLQISNVPVIHSSRNVMVELLDAGKIKLAADIALQYHPRGQYSLVTRPLLKALAKTNDINSFINILHVTSSQPQSTQLDEESTQDDAHKDSTDSNEVGKILMSAVKSLTKPEQYEQLLVAALSKGLKINTESAEAIEQCIGKNMTTNLSEILSQLTSSDLEPVPLESPRRNFEQSAANWEKVLARIKSQGGSAGNRIQRQLILAYIKENNVEKFEKYLDELKSSNFEPSVSLLAHIFEFYCQNDNIEKALQTKAEINTKDPEFILNRLKLIQMAYALVRANRFEEAIKFLTENAVLNDSENSSFLINSKCWQMLNTLAEQKDADKVNKLTKVLIDKNYIEASNIVLGPSIKVHLLCDDLDGALKVFENCCKQYRTTPWKGELMKALIMKEDATKLQWLADLSTQIHGEVNILHDLVLAFIECGRLRQARRILETPGLHTRQRRLENACQRYVEEGKPEYLEGLLEATKELSHIDRSNIFYHLLVSYCNSNETDKALGLWTVLQEDGEIPSTQFLKHLGKHLKEKNREVPFVIPDEAVQEQKPTKVVAENKVKTKAVPKRIPADISSNVEELVQNGKNSEAMDLVLKYVVRGVMPKSSVLKYLLKNLALEGNVEKIQQLAPHIDENIKKNITYDDKLTLAIFTRGAGAEHVDSLYEYVQAAKTSEELEAVLKKFPRSNALASIIDNDDLVTKCVKVAELAASRGHLMPANLLWMEYVLAGNYQKADSIWEKTLSNAEIVVFRRLLQESHNRNAPELIEKLISTLKSNEKISKASIGNAYSRLINIHVMNDKIKEAIDAYEKAVEFGVERDHFNKNTLKRLQAIVESQGKELKF